MSLPLPKETDQDRLLKFLLPAKSTLFFYFIIGSILLIIFDISPLWQFINGHIFGTLDVQPSDYTSFSDPIFSFINKFDTPLLMLLWAVFGCVVFGIILIGQKIARTTRQEVAESRYLIGGISQDHSYWHSTLKSNLSFLLLAIVWISFMVAYFNGMLPWISQLFFNGLYGTFDSSYRIIAALLANTLALYLFIKLTQLLLEAWRQIRPSA